MRFLKITLLIIILMISGCSQIPKDYLTEKREAKEERMAWWREARFGMFIHWGLYAIPAGIYQGERISGTGEWIMQRAQIPVETYERFASQFNPVKFDADEWVQIAKNAGMKYIVITSKHHDGFCLWDSDITEWDVVDATPFHRDILKELAEACRDQGIRLCFYHSIMDWHHPDAQAPFYPNYNDGENSNPDFQIYVDHYLKPQVKELLTDYGRIGIMWFDGEWIGDWTTEMGKDMYNYVRNLQPEIIINNRVDKGRQGMAGLNREGEYAGDYGTPEQEIPSTGLPGVDWESCMTMNDTWGYKSQDDNWKSAEMLIRNLIDITSKGGNFLLNVGPTAEGLIPLPSIQRLSAMGKWLRIYGEAIYGTDASPFEKPEWGRFTQKGNTLYAHVFDWPADGFLNIPETQRIISRVYMLSDKDQNPLQIKESESGVTITLPEKAPDPIASVIVLESGG